MSLPGGGDRSPGLMSGGTLSCDLSHDACDVTYLHLGPGIPTPPPDRMTDRNENNFSLSGNLGCGR